MSGHPGPDGCECVIESSWLKDLRQRRTVSLESIVAGSGFSREHLSGVERGERWKCAGPDVVRAYEKAMDTTVEVELLELIDAWRQCLVAAHDFLDRIREARNRGM